MLFSLKNLTQTGTHSNLSFFDWYKVRFINITCLIYTCFILVNLFLFLFLGFYHLIPLTLLTLAFALLPIYLHITNHYGLAGFFFVAFPYANLTICLLLFGNTLRFDSFLFFLIGLNFLLYKNIRPALFWSSINFLMFLFIDFFLPHINTSLFEPKTLEGTIFVFVNQATALLLLIISFSIFKILESQKNKKIKSLNEELKHEKEQLKKINEQLKIEILQKEKTEKALLQSNQNLEQFAYAVSHDLKQPLRMIKSYSQLLHKRLAPYYSEEASEFSQYILGNVDSMNTLLTDLLEYSRINNSNGTNLKKIVSLNKTIALVSFHLKLQIQESHTQLEISPLPKIKGVQVHLVQLFQNLISNAIRHNKSPKPIIRIYSTSNENNIKIFVEDNGIGISPKHHQLVFEVFRKFNSPAYGTGTGIGLALCKKIVESMDGNITIKSNPDIQPGSVFILNFPNHLNQAISGKTNPDLSRIPTGVDVSVQGTND